MNYQQKRVAECEKPITIKQVAERLGHHDHTVRELCRTGKLRAWKRPGGNLDRKSWMIDPIDLKKYEASQRVYNDSPEFAEAVAQGYGDTLAAPYR